MEDIETYGDRCFIAGCIVPSFESFPDRSFGAVPEKRLIERTANATDGFYRLSFDKLSISFFKGELRLEGVSLEPDSKVFEHWAALDSLPDTYVSTRIEVIDFKGINLVWRWNYRQLHFNTFEIRSPEVRVYGSSGSNPLVSGLAADTVEHAESKTLYE